MGNKICNIYLQWNLICSKSNLPNISQSAFFIGLLLGAWMWGVVADLIGRKRTFFIASACTILSGFGTGLSLGYYSFILFRILTSLSIAGIVLSSYVLCVELVGMSARGLVTIIMGASFALTYPLVAVMAYFIRSWRVLVFMSSLLGIATFALIK